MPSSVAVMDRRVLHLYRKSLDEPWDLLAGDGHKCPYGFDSQLREISVVAVDA